MRNRAEELLLRYRAEAIERAHAAMMVPLAGYGVSLLVILCAFLRVIPLDLLLYAFGFALILPVALTLWAMWRVQKAIGRALGSTSLAYAIEGRIVESQVTGWPIIGSG